ncbi:uncharacterized protein LOC111368265 [Olea europaea var. sylvestris]|uniref:uncharacterized protein LOC111368265 n=1 Tax=Olea europaea var. sylvestris TaxID=158386 RepID=UPI000C1D6484|nr:uncharacterized protein LOC111368265 [Olea europaea var. sylvestris]
MVMQAIVIYNELRRRARHLPRAPHTNWNSEREITLTRMFGTSDTICRDLLRMKIGQFQRLCSRLRTYGLVDSKYVRIEEHIAIFLNIVGHDQRNRAGRFTFFRSGQTVSFYFHRVLHACLGLYRDVVINVTPHNSPYEKENVQPWYSFFKDAVGAIDGTHIATYVPLEEQGKYYLVDAGFPSVSGFLAPYRRTRYHRRDIEGQHPESSNELFNFRHSSLHVCEEDDLDSSDDEVNPTHVDVPEDETLNAHISFTNQEVWSNKKNAIADLMWADYLPNRNAGIDFD